MFPLIQLSTLPRELNPATAPVSRDGCDNDGAMTRRQVTRLLVPIVHRSLKLVYTNCAVGLPRAARNEVRFKPGHFARVNAVIHCQ